MLCAATAAAAVFVPFIIISSVCMCDVCKQHVRTMLAKNCVFHANLRGRSASINYSDNKIVISFYNLPSLSLSHSISFFLPFESIYLGIQNISVYLIHCMNNFSTQKRELMMCGLIHSFPHSSANLSRTLINRSANTHDNHGSFVFTQKFSLMNLLIELLTFTFSKLDCALCELFKLVLEQLNLNDTNKQKKQNSHERATTSLCQSVESCSCAARFGIV